MFTLFRIRRHVQRLVTTDVDQYRDAVNALVKLRDPRTVTMLLPMLGARNASHAAEVLGELGDVRAVEPLIAALTKRSRDYSFAPVEEARALGKLGDARAVDPLMDMLESPYVLLAEVSAEALGSLGDRRATDALTRALGPGHHSRVRKAAATALGVLCDSHAVAPLIQSLADSADAVRVAAADALTRLGEPSWQSAIKGKEGDVDRLATMDDSRKFEPLFAALESAVARSQEKEDESLRYVPKFPELPGTDGGAAGVIHALAKLGDRRCSGPVARFVRDIDLGWRVYAAVDAAVRLLGECGDESGAEVLIECLSSLKGAIRDGHRSSPDSHGVEVCEPAIDALTKIGSVAVPPLIRTLGQGCDRERATKARILGEIGDRRAIDALIDRIGDIDGPVRASAAKALARLGEPKWQQWITGDELQDAERIAKSGEKRAVEFVVQMMDLSCRSGFWSAEPRDIQIKLLADMLRTAPDIYGAAASRALAGRGSAAVASVVELLNDSNPTVRKLAAEALGSMSYPAAVEALSRALEDDDDRVLKSAGESLRKLKQAEP